MKLPEGANESRQMRHLKLSSNILQLSQKYRHPTACLKTLLWLLGLSGLVFYTISDFLDLLNDYSQRNVASQISVSSDDGHGHRPEGVTECIPYYSGALDEIINRLKGTSNGSIDLHGCMECEAMREHSWDIWSRPELEDPNLLPTYIVEKLVKESSFDVLELNRSNFNWNQPILDAVWKFLSCSSYADYSFIAPHLSSTYQSAWLTMCSGVNLTRLSNVSRGTIDRFENASIRAFAIYSRIKLLYPDERVEYQALTDRSNLRFGAKFMCMPLWPNISIESIEYRSIQGDFESPPWMRYPRSAPYRLYPNDNVLYSFTFGLGAIYFTDYATLKNITVEEVSLSYSIDSIVRETRSHVPCNRDSRSSMARCVAERQVVDIVAQCGCVPFLYRHLQKKSDDAGRSTPYCDVVRYQNCTAGLLAIYDNYTAVCTNRCEHVSYTWNYYHLTKNDPGALRFEAELMHLLRAPFVEFSMTVKSTPTQFISQIGGIVNFYLGFSGLSICGFVILCIDILWECFKVRRSSKLQGGGAECPKADSTTDGIDRKLRENSTEIEKLKEEISKLKKNMRRMVEEKFGKDGDGE